MELEDREVQHLARRTVHHVSQGRHRLRFARQGDALQDRLRRHAGETAVAGRGAEARRGEGIRTEADDAAHEPRGQRKAAVGRQGRNGPLIPGAVAGRRRIPLAMEDRGDDTVRQTVLRIREHPRDVLRELAQHVRDSPGDDLFHCGMARTRGEEGSAGRAHRTYAPALQRRPGVLPVRARGRNKTRVLAIRQMGDEGDCRTEDTAGRPAGPSGLGRTCIHKRRIAAAEEDATTNRSEASPRKEPGSR